MATGIEGKPNTYDFGLEFDYSLWLPGTQVDLVNVPWNNTYRDVVKFANQTALDTYINGLAPAGIRIEDLSYVKPYEPIRVNITHSRALRFNYLRATNPLQPVDSDIQKSYYYFILDARYIAPNTTELIIQLDVWSTFNFSARFGNCYVERGHIGIANENQFVNYGRDYLTIPEGLDIGGEYRTIGHKTRTIIDTINSHDVIAVSTVDLLADAGTFAGPKLVTAPGGTFQLMPSGASFYAWASKSDFSAFMLANQNKPWRTQGIVSVTMIPPLSRYHPGIGAIPSGSTPTRVGAGALAGAAGPSQEVEHTLYPNWREAIRNLLPSRYRHLFKFLTSPYLIVEMTAFTGSSLIVKPESWQDEDATVIERGALIPPNQRVMFSPRYYNASAEGLSFDDGERLAMAIGMNNFPTMPVVNNMAISYLASNANSIAWQNSSADWSQQRALGSAQASYDVASSGMNLAQSLTGIGIAQDAATTGNTIRTQTTQQAINSIAGVAGGGLGGASYGAAGAGVGAAQGALSGIAGNINQAIQNAANNEAFAIRTNASQQSNAAQIANSGFARDTNKNLADWAARGDYANTIAGINARVQDAMMTQPSMSGTFGGDAFNLVMQQAMLYARWKMLDPGNLNRIGDIWLRYGYAIQRFLTPPASLMVMEKFTYWKMTETYLIATNIPEAFKQAIRGIFEKGVTVWKNPADIGVIDLADNDIVEGISY